MKLRIIDRLLIAVAGLMLVALAVIPLADTLFGADILVWLNKVAEFKNAPHLVFMLGGGAVLLAVGLFLLRLATRRVQYKGFVVQNTEVGELSISIRAIEDLVNRCVEKHEELHVTDTVLENTHDGLVIKLRAGLATGVNIPLAVTALQKQVKQYVTACSGVDVCEVKVQVETSNAKAKPSVYAVPDMLENPPAAEETAADESAEVKEPEEKCLHQRLFGEEDQPANMPVPPVEASAEGAAEAPVEEEQEAVIPTEEATEAWESNVPSDEELEACEKKVPAEEIVAEWEKAEEEATEAAADLDTLSGLSEEAEEAIDCVADEKDVAELAALDGAEDAEEV